VLVWQNKKHSIQVCYGEHVEHTVDDTCNSTLFIMKQFYGQFVEVSMVKI